jgi:flagellar hook assembly protein FlgD
LKVRGYFEWKIVVDNSRTDTQGKFQGWGFLGQYDIKVVFKDTIHHQIFQLQKGENLISIILKTPSETSIKASNENLPDNFKLEQNYPNPFNSATIIPYTLPDKNFIKLSIFNQLGQEIKCLTNESKSAGSYSAIWDGRDESGYFVANGLYFYKIQSTNFNHSRKMLFIK